PEMSYSWDIEGGIIVEGQGEHWITFRAGEVEHVRLSVRVDSPAGTYATSEVVIPTLVIPEAKITTVTGPVAMGRTGLQASVPKQPLVTYYWEVVNGTIEEGQRSHAMTFTAGDPGNVTVRVYVYSPSHATATGQKTIPVRAE